MENEKVNVSPDALLLAINNGIQQALLKNSQLVQALTMRCAELQKENEELKKALPAK